MKQETTISFSRPFSLNDSGETTGKLKAPMPTWGLPSDWQHGVSRLLTLIMLVWASPDVGAFLSVPPGVKARPQVVQRALVEAYRRRLGTYPLRTTHLSDKGEPKYTNRLVHEDSPYLLQHAHNPVDWYPWGTEAFEKSNKENKPIFLSIGYSTCHWCHVMEHESFEDEAIAQYLNEHFVSIKLDREQRPDLDEIYMTGVQLLTGHGGWPMSNFLTEDGKPFFAGTYFPPQQFIRLLQQIVAAWQSKKPDLLAQAEKISAAIRQLTSAVSDAAKVDADVVQKSISELIDRADWKHGGFGQAPKFPNETSLLHMWYQWQRSGDRRVLEFLELTLSKLAAGGIYDQIAGGFHRYAVDRIWLVPHFEKMLYNQAQLVRVYALAYELTRDPLYKRVITQTCDYILRDMTSETHGFYSATDADSEGEEGIFFTWDEAELDRLLSDSDAALVKNLYGVNERGNFEGKNILYRDLSWEEFAAAEDLPLSVLADRLKGLHQLLYEVREKRIHPLRDEKIISAWNGMMISSLVAAYQSVGRTDYLDAAVAAADRIWSENWTDGELWRITLGGHQSIQGMLEDYAHVAEAFLFVHQATGDASWLDRAEQVTDVMLDRFWDPAGGGFFMGNPDQKGPLITRPKGPTDGATASGNSVALHVLLKLLRRTGELKYRTHFTQAVGAFSGLIAKSPSAFSYMLVAIDEYNRGANDRVQYAADGNIRVEARSVSSTESSVEFEISFVINEGWHLNAHDLTDPDLIPTRVSGATSVVYPRSVSKSVAFQDEPLKLYVGQQTISGVAEIDDTKLLKIKLDMQACNDELCLQPESLEFNLPVK